MWQMAAVTQSAPAGVPAHEHPESPGDQVFGELCQSRVFCMFVQRLSKNRDNRIFFQSRSLIFLSWTVRFGLIYFWTSRYLLNGRWMKLMSFGIVVDLRRSFCSDKFIRFVQIQARFGKCLTWFGVYQYNISISYSSQQGRMLNGISTQACFAEEEENLLEIHWFPIDVFYISFLWFPASASPGQSFRQPLDFSQAGDQWSPSPPAKSQSQVLQSERKPRKIGCSALPVERHTQQPGVGRSSWSVLFISYTHI